MGQETLPTGTVTFLFTDIEGSTHLLQRLGEEYAALLASQRQILRLAFARFNGVEIDTQGDAFFVVFHRALDAIHAVVDAQRLLADHPWPQGVAVRVRMALHTGEPQIGPTGYIGLDVHRAARLCSAGHGGQVLLSDATRALVEQSLPEGVSLRDLGEHRLKDLQYPEKIYQLLIAGLTSDFPPLKSLNVLPNNLPLQLTSFVGRESEISEIKRLIASVRLLTLTGVGGTGKTRLALQVSAELVDSFKDGAWIVELAPLADPARVVQAVATVFGVRDQPGSSILDLLIETLKTRSLLIILDNCEHLIEACARLSDVLLRLCPEVKIMATSREGLGIAGETLWTVPPLSFPSKEFVPTPQAVLSYEAVRLFSDRAKAVNQAFAVTDRNAAYLVQVCQRLDGIPLAIELAAARLRAMTVEQLAGRLDDRFRLLTGGSRIALPHHLTLHAMIDWSYILLSEPERELFSRTSVFAGGWTMEAAEQVCSGEGIEVGEVLDLLTSLVDKSLVVVEPQGESDRYRLLETIRQYAGEKLQAGRPADRFYRKHFQYYLSFVQESEKELLGTREEVWLKLLDLEKDNVYAALTWAVEQQEDERDRALLLAGGLWMWWLARGALSEGRGWLEKTLESGACSASPRAKALAGAGTLAWQQGDILEAKQYLEESLSILHPMEPPDAIVIANSTHILGHLALDQKDYINARLLFIKSLGFYRELKDQYYISTLSSDLGMVDYHEGDYASARARQKESLALLQTLGNPDVLGQTQHRLGELARLEGDYGEAARLYESSLDIFKSLGFKLEVASNIHKLGFIAQHRGDFQNAQSLFRESLSLQQEAGNKQGIAECLAGFGGLAAVTGQPARALRLFAAAQALLDSTGIPMAPADRAEMERDQAVARALMDEAACSIADTQGRGMTVEQAIVFAMSD